MKMISPVSESAYSKAVVAEYGTLLFISGQESIDQNGRLIAPGDFNGQIQQVWNNMRAILDKAGGELDKIATMTVYTTERRWGRQFTSGRKEIFKHGFPASAFVEARKLRTSGALLQIPAIAVLDERKRNMSESPEKIFIDPLPRTGAVAGGQGAWRQYGFSCRSYGWRNAQWQRSLQFYAPGKTYV
jgi:enamine deaminase RidA (YjgF/YER057c/UK114 family)